MSCQNRCKGMPYSSRTETSIRDNDAEDLKPDSINLETLTGSASNVRTLNTKGRSTLKLPSWVCSKHAEEIREMCNIRKTAEASLNEELPETVPSEATSASCDTRVSHRRVTKRSHSRGLFRESEFLNKHIAKPGNSEGVWKHDLYDDVEQTAKSDDQIVSEYGRNIRKVRKPYRPGHK